MFQLYIVIHTGAFKIYFAAVVMVLGGVSLLTNQKLYRFLVKPHFEFAIFPQFRSRLSVCGALRRQPIVWTISRLYATEKTKTRSESYNIFKLFLPRPYLAYKIPFKRLNAEKPRTTMICAANNNELNASSVKEEITLHYKSQRNQWLLPFLHLSAFYGVFTRFVLP